MSVAMEDSATNDQSSGRSASRLLRYPLRSATRSKDDKPPLTDSTNSHSATKRGRLGSSVTKSVGVLDLSGKEKSAKPPRRLSVPSKSNASPAPKSLGNITPISEARSTRSGIYQGKSDTPISEVSKTSSRKKFSAISSASYWLSQIKLSESAAKHSISLGFFKLALEAGCAPIQTTRIRDELKSYVHRHNLSEFGESIKELFDSYKISENYEASRTGSEVPPEPNQLSDDDVRSSSSSITDAEKVKPKLLEKMNSEEIHQVKKSSTETSQKDDSVKTKRSASKNPPSSKTGPEVVKGRSIQKKPQKPIKQESAQDNKKKQGKKSAREEVAGPLNSPPKEEVQENKENMVASPQMEDITPEVV